MATDLLRATATSYLEIKKEGSTAVDKVLAGAPRLAVIQHPSPRAAVDAYMAKGNPYTGDPLRGAIDYYLHPERLQAALAIGPDGDQGWKRQHIDCDDVAGLYLAGLKHLPGMAIKMVTIVDARFTLNNMSHVLTAGEWQGKAFACDTNGYHDLPDISERTLCAHWNALYRDYGTAYAIAVDTPYPFA